MRVANLAVTLASVVSYAARSKCGVYAVENSCPLSERQSTVRIERLEVLEKCRTRETGYIERNPLWS